MVAAFKVVPDACTSQQNSNVSGSHDEDDDTMENTCDVSLEGFDHDENLNDLLYQGLTGWNHAELKRNGCLAHLLQLAIKDGIKSNTLVPKLTRRVNELVTFFSKSPMWKDALRSKQMDYFW